MNRLEALVGLNLVADIGSVRLNRLLDIFQKPENILRASPERLTAVSGIGEEAARKIHSFKKEELNREFALAAKHGLNILTPDNDSYPENLRNIPDSPIVLYVKGKLNAEDKFSIGIVGSRRASFYGLDNAGKFASKLAENGLTVVSGMARGIDTCAHRGALKAGGRTIAVLGSGFDNIYPKENKDLVEEIAASGAVVSEFPIGMPPLRQNFPRRNRVISGISLGVLVVEAARNSGALITADFALEQGREVFALPGKVDSHTSHGTNELIKQGAKLVSCLDDILEELLVAPLNKNCNPPPAPQEGGPESEEEKQVYGLIKEEPLLIDEIAEKTDFDIPRISDILLKLEMKKLIRQLPGKQFTKSK